MTTLTSKYNEGQIVYFNIYSSVEIISARVTTIHFKSHLCPEDISYSLTTDHFDYPTKLEFVGESQLHTFLEAKAALLSWLEARRVQVAALVDPVV